MAATVYEKDNYDGAGNSENVTLKWIRVFFNPCRVYSNSLDMSYVGKLAALELISWRPHLSLERESRRRFSRRGREVTAKKCPKKNP